MDIGLSAAMMARVKDGDDRRFEGCAMLSALPGAPVVGDRRGAVRRLASWRFRSSTGH